LYEQYTQRGTPSLIMMARINKEMSGMDFHVSKEAAEFATEAHIHQMCTVANLIRTCCFEGAAYTLVTNLGPERFTEWKAALINEATGKVPRLFAMLETCVRKGKFEPGKGALECGYPTPGYDITKLIEDMVKLRSVLKDLRRAELVAAKEHDRIRAAARDAIGDGTGAHPTPPAREGITSLTLTLALTPMGSTIRRRQRQQQHQQATASTAPTATTTLLGRWLKTAEVRDREMKPD
jgi:hypothetical protein